MKMFNIIRNIIYNFFLMYVLPIFSKKEKKRTSLEIEFDLEPGCLVKIVAFDEKRNARRDHVGIYHAISAEFLCVPVLYCSIICCCGPQSFLLREKPERIR